MKKKILVTSISGRVGQALLRSLNDLNYNNIEIIGTDCENLESGAHLCDKLFEVPFGNSENYTKKIKEICDIEKIDLIIPTHDLNVFNLSQNKALLPQIACSKFETIDTFFDKYKSFLFSSKNDIQFAESFLPSNYNNNFTDIIVKPRRGYGWKDLHINPVNPKNFNDDFVIQKLYKGIEISTPFYVDKKGNLVGFINILEKYNSFKRVCKIVKDYDKYIEPILLNLIKKIEISGVCELESIFDINENKIVIFEINCRFSNTVSLRSKFGFNDTKLLVDEFVLNKEIKKKILTTIGSSVRIFKDIIYKDIDISSIKTKTNYSDII